jgi:nucleotide-binding universal stress UspA family protein
MQALDQARILAASSEATIILLAVAPLLDDLGLAESGVEPLWMMVEREAQETYLQEALDRVATELRLSGLRVQTRVLAGDPVETIIRTCREEAVDLLLMATHGRSSLRRLFLGSVTTGVLHHAEVPVLLIRPQPQPRAARQASYEARGRAPVQSPTSTSDDH